MARRRKAAKRQGKSATPSVEAPAPRTDMALVGARHTVAAAAGALVGMAVLSYLPAMLWGGFVWDDVHHIPGEPALLDWDGLRRIWLAPDEVHEPHYRPLTYTSFWLEHKLWGFDPRGYHLVNVLLHGANTLLLWRILTRFGVPGAWLVAAVFAVHPLHVESVAWIIERKDVLSGLFYLGCVRVLLPFLQEGARPGAPWRYGLALALLAAGMLAKNMVVTLPAALVILHWWRNGWAMPMRALLTRGLLVAPFFVVALGLVAVDMWQVTTATPTTGAFDHSLVERLLIAARAAWFYVGKLAWPADLAVIYPRWDIHAGDWAAWAGVVAWAALLAALCWWRDRLGRAPLAAVLFYGVTLSPTLGFVDHTYMTFSYVADRYQYLAGIAVLALAVGGAAAGARRLPREWRVGAAGAAPLALLLLGALTWRQAGMYSDNVTLFRHVLAINPEAVGAQLNLSDGLIEEQRFEEAAAAARIAVRQLPNSPDAADAHMNLGIALSNLERYGEAERHFREAARLAPGESGPLANLGVLLHRLDRQDEAEAALRQALEIDPDNMGALRNLAKLQSLHAEPGTALATYERLVERGGADVSTLVSQGDLLRDSQRFEEALAAWRKALARDPEPPTALALHLSMGGVAWAATRSPDAAAAHFEKALAIDPRHPGALADLASLRIVQERHQDAARLFRLAIEVTGGTARHHAGLGYALYRLDSAEAAVASLERALALDPSLEEARGHLALARSRARLRGLESPAETAETAKGAR